MKNVNNNNKSFVHLVQGELFSFFIFNIKMSTL